MIGDLNRRRAWALSTVVLAAGVGLVLVGPASRAQESLPGEMELSYSSPRTDTTKVGDLMFHGPFNVETLTIGAINLPAHEYLDISFDLLILCSWDGSVPIKNADQKPIDIGPDFFRLGMGDGRTLLYTTFSNAPTDPPGFRWESLYQTYPSQIPGDLYPRMTGAAAKNTLGYNYPHAGPPRPVPMDATYHIHFVVPHHGDLATLEMSAMNLQDAFDESWGVVNAAIKPLDAGKVTRPAEKEIAAAFNGSLDARSDDLPGRFQALINGMDDTTAWIEANVKPTPVDSTKVAALIADMESNEDQDVEKRDAAHIKLLTLGHAVEPSLRDARKNLDDLRRVRVDTTLSVLGVRPPASNAAVIDWITAPPKDDVPAENMRRMVLATRVLEIIGTPKALALRTKLTLATPSELSAMPHAAAAAKHPGALADDQWAMKFQAALGIPDTGADITPALADAFTKVLANNADATIPGSPRQAGTARGAAAPPQPAGGPPTAAQVSLESLAAALLKGPHPQALVEKYLPWLEIGSVYTNATTNSRAAMSFDTNQQMYRLSADMWGLAKSLQATDPKKAGDLGRAAMMLGGMCDYGSNALGMINKLSSDSAAKKLLDLPEGQFETLRQLYMDRTNQNRSGSSMETGMAVDSISNAKDAPVDMTKANMIVNSYDNSFRKGMPQIGQRYETIERAFEFLNLMKQRKSAEGEAAVRAAAEGWKKDYPDADVARWVEQALTREGRVPGTQVGFIVNGKSVTYEEFQASTRPGAATRPATRPTVPLGPLP